MASTWDRCENRVEAFLREGQLATQAKTAGTCGKILANLPALWTFVDVEGVEPTNNVAEQTVRHGVLYRNVSFGTQSEWGSNFVARILTVHATRKKQHRSALQFILESCKAELTGRSPPSLLPASGQPASDENAAALAAAA